MQFLTLLVPFQEQANNARWWSSVAPTSTSGNPDTTLPGAYSISIQRFEFQAIGYSGTCMERLDARGVAV
jgi:hypothetical protein